MVRVTLATATNLNDPADPDRCWWSMPGDFGLRESTLWKCLSCFLDHAHQIGLEKIHCLPGGRPARHRHGDGIRCHPDTVIDVYGSPGEYCGAFNMGATVRVHGHAQNFTGMVMHSGTLEIHGDVGKVTGYSAKGGTFHILGNVVDRGWVCAVSDPRGPGLEVNIVGTACEHLCQALMGGSVLMLGLFRDHDGTLRRMPSPYSGAKILAGASAGEVIFYDPNGKLDEAQYQSCKRHPVDDPKMERDRRTPSRPGEPLQPRVPQKKWSSHR